MPKMYAALNWSVSTISSHQILETVTSTSTTTIRSKSTERSENRKILKFGRWAERGLLGAVAMVFIRNAAPAFSASLVHFLVRTPLWSQSPGTGSYHCVVQSGKTLPRWYAACTRGTDTRRCHSASAGDGHMTQRKAIVYHCRHRLLQLRRSLPQAMPACRCRRSDSPISVTNVISLVTFQHRYVRAYRNAPRR